MASLGLQAVGTRIYRNGQPFRHIGVNHFSLFQREMTDLGIPNPGLVYDCRAMAAAGFKVVRVGFGFYSYALWRDCYYNQQANYWATVDRVMDAIASAGLICMTNMGWSLLGFTQLTFLSAGSTKPPRDLADKTSALYSLFTGYVTTFVQRYKNHPAVASWEIGNESSGLLGNEWWPTWAVDGTGVDGLATPLPFVNMGTKPEGGTYSPSDKMAPEHFLRYSQTVRQICDTNDPWGRIVCSGETAGNSFAVRSRRVNSIAADAFTDWSGRPDTGSLPWVQYRDQFAHVLCDHIYPLTCVPADGTWFSDGKQGYAQQIANLKTWANGAGKPAVLEEFGATQWGSSTDPLSTNLATEQANFNTALGAVVANDIPLALVWNWGGALGPAEWMKWDITVPARRYQLDAIQLVNATRL